MIGENKIERRRSRNGQPTARELERLVGLISPDCEQSVNMVQDLIARWGITKTSVFLGAPVASIRRWQAGGSVTKGVRRSVWLIWAVSFHGASLANLFDLITYGRFT
jgi:hypothetical protein